MTSKEQYTPANDSGVVRGDSKAMPDRGTGTGMTGLPTFSDGRGFGSDDTNSMGSVGDTGSDSMFARHNRDDNLGGTDAKSGGTGSGMSGTGSDQMFETEPDDPTFGPAKGDDDSNE